MFLHTTATIGTNHALSCAFVTVIKGSGMKSVYLISFAALLLAVSFASKIGGVFPCVACPSQESGGVTWPETENGGTAHHNCTGTFVGEKSRECSIDGVWGEVIGECSRSETNC